MIGIDTNVLIRFLAQDDKEQSATAARFMSHLSAEKPGFISAVVLAEASWVLRRSYQLSRSDLAATLRALLESAELIVENTEAAWRALAVFEAASSAEFADALIAETAALAGAAETVTFDRDAAAEAGMKLLQ